MAEKEEIANLLLEKFVNEEIMTKSEFQLSIDRIMDRHEANINNKFEDIRTDMKNMEERVDSKFQIFDNKLQDIRIDMKSMDEHFTGQFLKIDLRYNWIIGIVIASTIGIMGMGLKIISMIPH